MKKLLLYCLACLVLGACGTQQERAERLFDEGCYPYCMYYEGSYYYTMQTPDADTVFFCRAEAPGLVPKGQRRVVYSTAMSHLSHFWSPELHRIDDKWYLYFEADDGNTDNHQIYVMENTADDPMSGSFVMKGIITTNEEWNFGLHPTVLHVHDRCYLLWSGWPTRRAETETQCIYIAEMENPWTLKSRRVMISWPQYEWERQWVNPDGSRSAYPIYVNENPEAFLSPDGSKVIVCYSASGIWTQYSALGMLYADANSDLLNPSSWTKRSEPSFCPAAEEGISGTSNISIVSDGNSGASYIFYETKTMDDNTIRKDVRLQRMTWSADGMPLFGKPLPLE